MNPTPPLFTGVVEARPIDEVPAKDPVPPKEQPTQPPVRVYGGVYGPKKPDPILSW